MTTAYANLYVTMSKYLPELTVEDGNIVFTKDTGSIYLDFDGVRLPYQTINNFSTDNERIKCMAVDGYYYVEETNVLWRRKDGGWVQITPSNMTPINYYKSTSDFPAIGDSASIYLIDDVIYRYDPLSKSYASVSNLTDWKAL